MHFPPIQIHIHIQIQILILHLNLMSAQPTSLLLSGSCQCRYGDLVELEKLNMDHKRLRIENPNALVKYSESFLTYNAHVDCLALAVYVLYRSAETMNKKCRKCVSTGWTELHACESPLKCDLDLLSTDYELMPVNSNRILNDQNLFRPNHAIAVYKSTSSSYNDNPTPSMNHRIKFFFLFLA